MAAELPTMPFKLTGSSERALFSFGFVVTFLCLFAQCCYCVSIGEVAEPLPQLDDEKPSAALTTGDASARVKRSPDGQQLCGVRLLVALQSVCNRNFVGFVRRSDPTFLDDQSGEESILSNLWELAGLIGADSISSNALINWEGIPLQDYLEPRPSYGSKVVALKMLSEPPKTHQRFRRSIIDECCKKPCVPSQMLKYCGINNMGKRSV